VADKHYQIVEIWPMIKEDMENFISDRPGWFINALENARKKKGIRGWNDVETITNILQFLKDTEVEY